MTNKTVYPYGTGGSLPSNIGIINDITTGGADKALSAEMGKKLGEEMNMVTFEEELPLSPNTVGYYIKNDGTWAGGGLHRVVEVTPGSTLKFKVFNSDDTGNFYAWLTDAYTGNPVAGTAAPLCSGTTREWASDSHGWYEETAPDDAAYLYLIFKNGSGNTSEWIVEKKETMPTAEAFERYVFDDEQDPTDSLQKYEYEGPIVKAKEIHKVAVGEVADITPQTYQGGACYGNYLFMFTENNTTCWVYDLEAGTLLQTINIPAGERGFVGSCHCNTVNFGTEKYDAGDPFPLIYVSTGYNDGTNTGALVYRIVATTVDNVTTYSLTLVQTLKMPGATWTEFVVGDDGNCFLCYTTPRTIYRMEMPKLSDGDLTFDLDDALEVYQFTPQPASWNGSRNQNRIYANGKIMFVSGVPNANEALLFVVLDLATRTREVVIDLKNTFNLTKEPETCFIWNNHICIVFRTYTKVYALYFFE